MILKRTKTLLLNEEKYSDQFYIIFLFYHFDQGLQNSRLERLSFYKNDEFRQVFYLEPKGFNIKVFIFKKYGSKTLNC